MTRRVLLTGAAGFAGSHILRHLLAETGWEIICPASWAHRGEPARILAAVAGHDRNRVTVVTHDLAAPFTPGLLPVIGEPDIVMNAASESAVERSISDPVPVVLNNTALALTMLEHARKTRPRMFLQMGTDEVYGPVLNDSPNREWDTMIPSNPYSASKAAQDCIAISYWRTYGLPLVLTRTMNLFGPYQSAEKLIPVVIRKVLAGERVPIYSSPEGVPGSRCWIDAREFAGAWLFLAQSHTPGAYPAADRPDMFHVAGEEHTNLEVAQMIAEIIGKPLKYGLVPFHASRPGHDLAYALDASKLAAAGWKCQRPFAQSLAETVRWYLDNPHWLDI